MISTTVVSKYEVKTVIFGTCSHTYSLYRKFPKNPLFSSVQRPRVKRAHFNILPPWVTSFWNSDSTKKFV